MTASSPSGNATPRATTSILLILLAAGVGGAIRNGRPAPSLLAAALLWCGLPLLLAAHFRSACFGAPGLHRSFLAGLLFLAPGAAWCARGLFVPASLGGLAALPLAGLGLVLALFALRDSLRGRASDATPLPRGLVVLGALAVLALATVAAQREVALFEVAVEQERAAQERAAQAAFVLDAPAALTFENAISARGPFRNADVAARLVVGEASIAAIRVRAIEPDSAQGIALFLSSDPRFESGFYLETQDEFALVAGGATAVRAGGSIDLLIECRGRRIEALVDGRPFARVEERRFAEGAVVALCARGKARVESLTVTPVDFAETRVNRFADAASGAAAVLGAWLAWTILAAGLLRAAWSRIVAAAAAPALLIALLTCIVPVDGPTDDSLLAVGFALVFLLQLGPVLALAKGSPAWRGGTLVVAALACCAAAGWSTARRAWPPDFGRVNAIGVTHWSGTRLEADLLDLQHPAIRRFDNWQARHELRLVTPSLEKKPFVPRVLCIGSSSTNGYWLKLPYPFRVQLALEKERFQVEVMVGAVPGSTGSRLYYDLKNVLLAFDPDVVTLSLYFNDSYALTQMDEAAYLRRITAPGYRATWLERLRDRREAAGGLSLLRRALVAFGSGDAFEWPEGVDPPAVRFENMLRDFAQLLAERGIALVLVQEPVAGDRPRLWKDEFRAAMNRVGAEFELEVVDPTPALQEKGGAKLFMDEVHPLEDGAQVIAEALAPAVRRAIERRAEKPPR